MEIDKPLLPNTTPIFAFLHAMRMFIGSVIVIPMPTAAPWIAPMVGLRQCWMARATRPPLFCFISHRSLLTTVDDSAVSHVSYRRVDLGKKTSHNPPIPMPLPPFFLTITESNIQIRTRTKHPPIPRNNNTLNPIIHIEHGIRFLQLLAHGIGKSIMIFWAKQREDDDSWIGDVVACLNLGELRVVVG
jgi:hypothetical protein